VGESPFVPGPRPKVVPGRGAEEMKQPQAQVPHATANWISGWQVEQESSLQPAVLEPAAASVPTPQFHRFATGENCDTPLTAARTRAGEGAGHHRHAPERTVH